MPKAFPEPGKGFPKSLSELRDAVKGGIVADSVRQTSGASPVVVDGTVYETLVRSGGTAGNENVELGVPLSVGQRKLVTFEVEGNAADVVIVVPGAGATLQTQGVAGDGAPAAQTSVDLDTPAEFVLVEASAPTVWNVIYTDGVITA